MTKYLVFKNQPGSGQTNVPGSSEEMACTIATVVSQDALPKDFYIAYPLENPHSTWESMKDAAKFSVEIDDERAELWEKEIFPLTGLAEKIDEAIGDAYSAIVYAAQALFMVPEDIKELLKRGDAFLGGSSIWARTRDLRINRNLGWSKTYINQ